MQPNPLAQIHGREDHQGLQVLKQLSKVGTPTHQRLPTGCIRLNKGYP